VAPCVSQADLTGPVENELGINGLVQSC
jgi:hypothetical protein